MRSQARVVIVGGGAMGVALLYHLAREGWSDALLLEKGELTSGSTWHAAGLVPHFIGDLAMARVHRYASELYARLEAETGQATGWHGCGAIRLATTREEVDWFHHVQGVLACAGAQCHLIGPAEIRALHPLLDTGDVLLGAYTPGDGHTDPAGSTQAMAAGARRAGAAIHRQTRVTGIERRASGEWEVITGHGRIVCEHVVNAAGCFAPQVGAMVGVQVPIVSLVHQYLVTEALPGIGALERELPVVRDPVASCYYRQEARGLLVGPYEMQGAQAWGLDGIDWGFDMELLAPALDRLQPGLEHAMRRIPAFAAAGIRRVVSGPITHTPDGGFLLGPAPGVRNFWMCCGTSIGITQAPGAGRYLAQWMVHGQCGISTLGMDPRRYGAWALGRYCVEKCIDEYQQMYQVHFPGELREAGRPLARSPIHARLAQRGAVFGAAFGRERPRWFSPAGEPERHAFRRSNAFAPVGEECRAVRERAGVMDLSSLAKFEVHGRAAAALLERLCANRLPRRDGRVVLAHLLAEAGGIECELTVTRLGADRFYLLGAAAARLHDLDWLRGHAHGLGEVQVEDVSEAWTVLALAGPRSREVLAGLTPADLDNAAFPWLSAREIEVAGVPVRALRLSYTGELGWELHHPVTHMPRLYEALLEAGAGPRVADFGTCALDALRMEKGYPAWGAELSAEVGPVEAALERFVDWDKDFVGAAATRRRRAEGPAVRLVQLAVEAGDAECLGSEPLHREGRTVGLTTSGAWGYAVQRSLAFAYVGPAHAVPGTRFEIPILGTPRAAQVLAEPPWDPAGRRPRA